MNHSFHLTCTVLALACTTVSQAQAQTTATDSLSTQQLQEAQVESQRVVHHAGYDAVYPTALQRGHAVNGLDLLEKMQLQGIRIDQVEGQISSTRLKGEVLVLLNGVPVYTADLQTVAPQQVAHVVVSTNPDMKYGPNVATVLDIRTRKDGQGWGLGFNTMNAITTNYNDDSAWFKAYNRCSEWGIRYNFKLNTIEKAFVRKEEALRFTDGTSLNLHKYGQYKGGNYRNDDLQLSYNYTRPDHRTFDIKASGTWDRFPKRTLTEQVTGDAAYDRSTMYESDEKRGQVKMYYSEDLSQKDKVTAYMAAAYMDNAYHRGVSREDWSDLYDVDGKKYSILGEADYTHTFSPTQRLTIGYEQKGAYTSNAYAGTGQASLHMHDDSQYAFAQHVAQAGRWVFVAGLGASRDHFREGQDSYTYWTVRPKAVVQFMASQAWQLVYTYERTPSLPSLSDLSAYQHREDDFQGTAGNPSLRPYTTDKNYFAATYQNQSMQVSLYAAYDHSRHTMDYAPVYEQDGLLWSTMQNGTLLHHAEAGVYVARNFFCNRLQVYVDPKYTFERSRGNGTHTNQYIHVQVGANAFLGKFGIGLYYRNATKSLTGETLIRNYSTSDFNVSYTHRALSIKAGLRNAFQPKGSQQRQLRENDRMTLCHITGNKGFGNMVYLSLSWNIFRGRQHQVPQAKADDANLDSGIMK